MKYSLPIQITFIHNKAITYTMDPFIHIFWIIDGEMQIQLDKTPQIFSSDQLVINNRNQPYGISPGSYKALDFKLDLNQYKKSLIANLPDYFFIDNNLYHSTIALQSLKHYLSVYAALWMDDNTTDLLRAESLSLNILSDLCTFFASPAPEHTNNGTSISGLDYIHEINQYIEKNYSHSFSLKDVSEHFFISTQYISKLYKTNLHMTFFSYVNQVRLSHAISEMQTQELTLEEISENCGFANSRAMATCFKDVFQMTPRAFRKNILYTQSEPQETENVFAEYCKDFLSHHMKISGNNVIETSQNTKKLSAPSIDINCTGTPLPQSPYRILCLTDAIQLIYQKVQELIINIQKDMSFTHIWMQRLFCNEMNLYFENTNNHIELNFSYTDLIFDFLYENKLSPYILLDSLPTKIQKNEKYCFIPSDYWKWSSLISQFIHHYESRYGKDYVSTWIFSIGSDINLHGTASPSLQKEFNHYFHYTYRVIRNVNSKIYIAMPSVTAQAIYDTDWLDQFMDVCRKQNQIPDILNFNLYPIFLDAKMLSHRLPPRLAENSNEHSVRIQRVLKKIQQKNWKFLHMIILSWNFTLGNNLLNDTMYRAVYTVKTVLQNSHLPCCHSCYLLSDFINSGSERSLNQKGFWGGWGLYTQNTIPKPIYFAWVTLSHLGTHNLADSTYYYVSRRNSSIQIFMYYYVHYTQTGDQNSKENTLRSNNRYAPFEDEPDLTLTLPLICRENTEYTLTETVINREHGSAFDTWQNFGGTPLDSKESVNYIKAISIPFSTSSQITATKGTLLIQRTLQPLEIRLLELTPLR